MDTNTIKLLPTSASVRAGLGIEVDYSAREFIRQCEDVISNSFVTDDEDIIAFVRSRLQPGSRACNLMQASLSPRKVKITQNFSRVFLSRSAKLKSAVCQKP